MITILEDKSINFWDIISGQSIKEIIPKDIVVEKFDDAFLSENNDKIAFLKSCHTTLWDI